MHLVLVVRRWAFEESFKAGALERVCNSSSTPILCSDFLVEIRTRRGLNKKLQSRSEHPPPPIHVECTQARGVWLVIENEECIHDQPATLYVALARMEARSLSLAAGSCLDRALRRTIETLAYVILRKAD